MYVKEVTILVVLLLALTSLNIIFFVPQGNNSVFTFGLADSQSMVPFAVDPDTGVITVSGALDYETTQQYTFMVSVNIGKYVVTQSILTLASSLSVVHLASTK